MDEIPSKKLRLGHNTLNNMNDTEAQEASDRNEEVLNTSGENHSLSPAKICDNCTKEAAASNAKRWVNLGSSDYDELNGCMDFIDKSLFAWHFLHDPDSPLLVTAPSRFGKTSILKMLEKFFTIHMTSSGVRVTNVKQKDGMLVEDLSNLSENFKTFKAKKIFEVCHCSPPVKSCDKCKQWFYEHCGQHPVILIDFGSIRITSVANVRESLNEIIRKAYKQHQYLVTQVNGKKVWSSSQNEEMDGHHVDTFLMYCNDLEYRKFWLNPNISEAMKENYLIGALPLLVEYLSFHFKTKETGKGVILLIDEFDAFVCEMIFQGGKKEEIEKNINDITTFIRYWARMILKKCSFVKKALLMACCEMGGILSLGNNNTNIRSFLDSHSYSESFGFTEEEVIFLVDIYLEKNSNETKEQILKNIDQWYNGYSIRETKKKIFSSFSILNYLRSWHLRSYWKDKMGSSRLDCLLAETPFHKKVFPLLNSPEGTTSINIVENIQPEHLLKLNELIKSPGNVSDEMVDLYLQFLTDCGFFNVIKKENLYMYIKIPNFEIDFRLRQKLLSGLLKKEPRKFDSSKISAFIASLKSLADTNASSKDIKPSCIEVAKCIANLYTKTTIPNNHFEIQADLYFLIRQWNPRCYAELQIDTGNSPRIDIFFNINENTSAVMEIKHYRSAKNVEAALQQILYKKYYRVCAKCSRITKNKILLGVFLAHDGKISVGCIVNFDEKNSPKVIMERRVCVDSDGNTLFPLNEEMESEL